MKFGGAPVPNSWSVTLVLGNQVRPWSNEAEYRIAMRLVRLSYHATCTVPRPSTAIAGMNWRFDESSFTRVHPLHVSAPSTDRLNRMSQVPRMSFAAHTT